MVETETLKEGKPSKPQTKTLTATIISILIGSGVMLAFLVVGISYRDSDIGAYTLGGLIALGLGLAIFLRPQIGAYVLAITIITSLSDTFTRNGFPSINKPLVLLVQSHQWARDIIMIIKRPLSLRATSGSEAILRLLRRLCFFAMTF